MDSDDSALIISLAVDMRKGGYNMYSQYARLEHRTAYPDGPTLSVPQDGASTVQTEDLIRGRDHGKLA